MATAITGLLSPSPQRAMNIVLDGDGSGDGDSANAKPASSQPVHTFTTHDDVRGHVAITASVPTTFSSVEISLLGTTRTITQSNTVHPAVTTLGASQVFLRLTMPLPPSAYPSPSSSPQRDSDSANPTYTLNPGTPLRIPFHFVIPDRLLPSACTHPTRCPTVQDAHCRLPPSLGGFRLPRDDLASEMATVTYVVHAKLLSPEPPYSTSTSTSSSSSFPIPLVSSLRKIHVTPTTPELPPLPITQGNSSTYHLTRSKSLRRGIFKGKLGTLTLTAKQPRAFLLSPSSSSTTTPGDTPSTLVTLTARFDPATSTSPPPRLGALTAKLRSTSTHSTKPALYIPDSDSTPSSSAAGSTYEPYGCRYSTSVSLPSHDVAAVPWALHVPAPAYTRIRRDSGYSTAAESGESSSPSSSPLLRGHNGSFFSSSSSSTSPSLSPYRNSVQTDNYVAEAETETESTATAATMTKDTLPYYTATIPIPLSLPNSKTWVPTFHSCLVSRFYTLALDLSVHVPGAIAVPPSGSLTLKVPVQIAMMGRTAGSTGKRGAGRGMEGVGRGEGRGVRRSGRVSAEAELGLWEGDEEDEGKYCEGDGLPGYVAPVRRRR